jgi:hypothetical protein
MAWTYETAAEKRDSANLSNDNDLDITHWLWAITNSLWVPDKSLFFDQTGPSWPEAALM